MKIYIKNVCAIGRSVRTRLLVALLVAFWRVKTAKAFVAFLNMHGRYFYENVLFLMFVFLEKRLVLRVFKYAQLFAILNFHPLIHEYKA